jgi:hypothetical protein
MKRYFFDFVRDAQILHDHQGLYCAGPDVARERAELIAIDLELSPNGEWAGWMVCARDVEGNECFSTTVRAAEAA